MFDPRFWLPAAALLAAWSGVALDMAWRDRPSRRWIIAVPSAALLAVAIVSLVTAPRPETPWTTSRAIERLAMTTRGQRGSARSATIRTGTSRSCGWRSSSRRYAPPGSDRPARGWQGQRAASWLVACDVVFALPPRRIPSTRNQQVSLRSSWHRAGPSSTRERAFGPSPSLAAILGSRARPQVFVRRHRTWPLVASPEIPMWLQQKSAPMSWLARLIRLPLRLVPGDRPLAQSCRDLCAARPGCHDLPLTAAGWASTSCATSGFSAGRSPLATWSSTSARMSASTACSPPGLAGPEGRVIAFEPLARNVDSPRAPSHLQRHRTSW